MTLITRSGALVAAIGLLAAGQALAKPHDNPGQGHGHGQGHGPKKGVTYVFKGTFVDTTTVTVDHGNGHARKADLTDGDVQFDFSAAKISAFAVNSSGGGDLGDVSAGDRVVVKARLPKGDPGIQPFAARQLVDQTHPAVD